MTVEFNWALCSTRAGDGDSVIQLSPERPPTLEYLIRVTSAAEEAGFRNILVPTGTHCVDPWTLSAAIANRTKRIKFFTNSFCYPKSISGILTINNSKINLKILLDFL